MDNGFGFRPALEGAPHHQTNLSYPIFSQPSIMPLPNVPSSGLAASSWPTNDVARSLAVTDAPEALPATSNRSNRRLVPNAVWEEHKNTLHRLYIVENLTLEDTMTYMEAEHGFKAT